MIRLYIDFEVTEALHGHIINWIIGWLYDCGYAFSYQKYDYSGSWSVDIHAKGLEPVGDIFEFALNFGNNLRHFAYEIDAVDIVVGVCGDEGCVDVRFEDLKRLEEQEFEEVEEKWQKMVESMIYGEDDDPEYIEYKEAIRWERLVGIRNDGDMLDAVLEQEGYE